MRSGRPYFALLCLFALGANSCQIPGSKYERSVSVSARGHGKKADLKAYLARVFGKKLNVQNGCPSILVPSDALFQPHTAKVNPANWTASIDTVAAICNRYPGMNLKVSAYTDCLHSEEHNLALSELQAWSIKKALVDKGLATRKITAMGWGEARPIASNATEEGRKANRRIRITFATGRPDGP